MNNIKRRFRIKKCTIGCSNSREFITFVQTNQTYHIHMRSRICFLLILMAAFLAPAYGQNTAGSSIASKTLLSSDGARKVEQRVYDNGLGDIVQEITSYTGSTLPSVVVRHEYDEYRRETKTWLPVTSSSGSGFISGSSITNLARSQYNSDSAPFSRTDYDAFLPSLPSAQFKAGGKWQNNGKKVAVTYSEYVGMGIYTYEDEGIDKVPNKKFLCTSSVDEDGCPTAEYTDLNGKLMISETSQGKTYYVYNVKGDLSYVIPPILSAYIVSHYGTGAGEVLDTDDMMQKYAYIYRYDNLHHCIYKKLPGCEPVYYVYDRTGACILTQDGNQRQNNEWAYTIPDKFGRPCISGICKNNISYTAEPLHSKFVYAEYDGSSTDTRGYTVHNLSLSQQTLYTATYYDSYSFIGRHGVPSSLTASSVSGYTIDSSLGHGLQTGSATAVINGGTVSKYIYSAIYYDSRYNVSQIKSTNHFGGTETTFTTYTYSGKPENVKVQHTSNKTGTLTDSYKYTYDGADRVSSLKQSIYAGVYPAEMTTTYEYDDLGRLSTVKRPYISGANTDINYTYDIHGWTTKITSGRFQEEISYADGPGTPCYNGNISSTIWHDDASNLRGYKYYYDKANRLTRATYGEGSSLANYTGRFSENLTYDAHGNVKTITRYGKTSTGYGLMDNLTLSYSGNQLSGVSETVADYDVSGSFEYKKAKGSQYLYDNNGSLIADKSRGIAYITYDSNGNPSRIYFTNGSETRYVYSATGQKLTVEHYTAKPNITRQFGVKPSGSTQDQIIFAGHTDYLLGGRLVVRENIIRRLLFDGGYAAAAPVGSTTYGLTLCHYNKDHLGNNREVVNSGGTVQQVTNYYPFGAPYADPAAVEHPSLQPYKYNGKELDTMHGLNTYDYGARQYDPVLGRWDRMDPLCEKYYSVSPYVYCVNNPVRYIDPDGTSIWVKGAKLVWRVGKAVAKDGLKALGTADTYASAFADIKKSVNTLKDDNASLSDKLKAGATIASEFAAVSVNDVKEGKSLIKSIIPNNGYAKQHGGLPHNKKIDALIDKLRKDDQVANIRKNQKQVDIKGNVVGNNRPDIQFDKNGVHTNVEYDTRKGSSLKHKKVLENNDPNARNKCYLIR